jgi:hypothetical protein
MLFKIACTKINELLSITVDIWQVLEMFSVILEGDEADESSSFFDDVCLVVHLRWLEWFEVAWEVH